MNKKLIRLLQRSHAVEIGAYEAYEGHRASLLKSRRTTYSKNIYHIQSDELTHRNIVKNMLTELKSTPNRLLDLIFWIIGKTISVSCYVMPYKWALWGAKLIEKMGAVSYYQLAKECNGLDKASMYTELLDMAIQEEEHENVLKEMLQ